MLQTAFVIPTLRKRSPVAQATKSLELSLEQHLYWLIVDDGRRFSASSAEALVSVARGHMGGNPLMLAPGDCLSVRGSMADYAPVLDALQPNVEMTFRLERSLHSPSHLPLSHQKNLINAEPWSWFFVPGSLDGMPSTAKWKIVPQECSGKGAQAVLLSSKSAAGTFESSLILKDSVGLEIGRGPAPSTNWVEIRYDVDDPTEFAREHLNRSNIGLPQAVRESSCPYCLADPYPDWKFQIKIKPPVSPDFVGEAMARIFEPCRTHLSTPKASMPFQGEHWDWKAGVGGGLQPRQPAVWERSRARAS